MDVYNKDFEVLEKTKNHPITEADIKSHSIIKNSLFGLLENTYFLSEESEIIDWNIRKKWERYWLVDPLDGTKEFVNKNGEFTVNIALIENHIPILGVIYAPSIDMIYLACRGLGSFSKKLESGEKKFNINKNLRLKVSSFKKKERLKMLSSRSHRNNEKMNNWLKFQKEHTIKYMGSSLKFCLIADGSADIYPRFRPTSEWDIAAGHCILKEAGGSIKTLDGNEIEYNKKESFLNPDFIASNS